MEELFVANVGSGLCMETSDSSGKTMQIDCGGNTSEGAFCGLLKGILSFHTLNSFTLSHLHNDHYNGLIKAASLINRNNYQSCPHFKFEQLYFPKIPDFTQSREFFLALLTLNFRILGEETGIAEYELIELVTTLNGGTPPNVMPVCQGMKIVFGNSIFSVLWPPPAINDNDVQAKAIARALTSFRRALEEDEPTRRWYEYVQNRNIIACYLNNGLKENESYRKKGKERFPEFSVRKLPEVVKTANKSIIKAANRLSLAFADDKKTVLFLGDLETQEISKVINYLCGKKKIHFRILVTPHHGTHWHNSLKSISCKYSVSSFGCNRNMHLRSEFQQISKRHYVTYFHGDLHFVRI